MEVKNCPNCGAAIQHKYNHNCPYCGTFFDFRIKQTEEINPRYLTNVELKRIEREYCSDRFVFVFTGDYVKWQECLEYGKNNTTIVLSTDDIKPKKICYAIAFDFWEMDELRMNNFEPLFKILPFEIDPRKFIEAIVKYNRDLR